MKLLKCRSVRKTDKKSMIELSSSFRNFSNFYVFTNRMIKKFHIRKFMFRAFIRKILLKPTKSENSRKPQRIDSVLTKNQLPKYVFS